MNSINIADGWISKQLTIIRCQAEGVIAGKNDAAGRLMPVKKRLLPPWLHTALHNNAVPTGSFTLEESAPSFFAVHKKKPCAEDSAGTVCTDGK
jgi:hypothetical protein